MMYGGSLSARGMRSRDDLAGFGDQDLDHRLPTSTRGSLSTALKDLAALGIQPGHYSGSEQLFAAGGNVLAPAIEPAACEILGGGSLSVASRTAGEAPTTFAWVSQRWRWFPYAGVIVEAVPRRMGSIIVIDFFRCEGGTRTAVARLSLAPERRP